MERTIPETASDEVELYLRTIYSLLRSTSDVQMKSLETAHASMHSLLHPEAKEAKPDMSALIYSLLRLPECIDQVQRVVMGQGPGLFERAREGKVDEWEEVFAPARRRRCYFNGVDTLACIIASRSDIDDLIPLLAAYQIERIKIFRRLRQYPHALELAADLDSLEHQEELAEILGMTVDDLNRLQSVWGDAFASRLKDIQTRPYRLRIRLLSGSLSEYRRATHAWWEHIEKQVPGLLERPVYFVSSNTHSLINLLTGFALENRQDLLDYLEASGDEEMQQEWEDIQAMNVPSSQENFFYYLQKKFFQTEAGKRLKQERNAYEQSMGIQRVTSAQSFDVDSQVIELSRLRPETLDARLSDTPIDFLARSDALIFNIDYPLGLAAYNILTEFAEHVQEVLGIYIIGKAATLNGGIGDVMIPNVVHDEQSLNTFLFSNAFTAGDITPYLVYGTCLDMQKAVTVRGTFLQTAKYMHVFYREGYTDIEMEAGPYLSAIYEMSRPKRHPVNEIVNLINLPFDLGMMHYASDTPLSKGKNLGAASLSYFGMDPTYATSIAVLRRIFQIERKRLA